jgi:hypothetical protein
MVTSVMKTTTNKPLGLAFTVVTVLFVFFGSAGLSGVILPGGMNESGWMGGSSQMWASTLCTVVLGAVLGWAILKRKK